MSAQANATDITADTNVSADRPKLKVDASNAIRNALIVLATVAVIWVMQWGKAFLIPLAVAIFATFLLMPLVDRLERFRVPRLLGAALVMLGLMGSIAATGYVPNLLAGAIQFVDFALIVSGNQHIAVLEFLHRGWAGGGRFRNHLAVGI